jgi:CubicO group peptidase (beta-lactamase class C family)
LTGLGGLAAAPLLGPGPSLAADNGVDTARMRQITQQFATEQNIPGLQIAIARQGKLIFNEPFGFADQASQKKVTRNSLFRIASVSKPITATAIFSLIEAGKLKLTDRVFGPGSIFGNDYGTKPLSARVRAVTVDDLLTHSAGGWQNDGTDPMFSADFQGMSKKALLSAVLDSRPLDYQPGTHYAYSNFGFFVLGRVIEKISGKRYDTFVKNAVFDSAGIEDMKIAGNGQAATAKNEVTYYSVNDISPYAFDIARMDSHGGWIATASDLVRFLLHYDGFKTIPDDLKAKTIAAMTTPSATNANYARGWGVNSSNNWWHIGSLPGTSSVMVRAFNGFAWAALANTRIFYTNSETALEMDNFVWNLLKEVGLIS